MTIVEPGGHSMSQSRPISVFSPNQTYTGNLSGNTPDFYKFTTGGPTTIQLFLSGQSQITLLGSGGTVLAQSQNQNGEQVLTIDEPGGTFYAEVVGSGSGGAYALTFDVLPLMPLISNLVISPIYTSAPPIQITATASLGTAGTGFIGGAEFFIDGAKTNGTGIAMTAVDGSFNEVTEAISGVIDGSLFAGLTSLFHVLYIHARDSLGNWGPFITMQFRVDTQGPVTSQLVISPVQSSTPPTFSGQVSDKRHGYSKIQAEEYFVDTLGQPGSGIPITLGKIGDGGVVRAFSGTIDANLWANLSLGQHTLYVEGEDVVGNWGPAVSVTFTKLSGSLAVALASNSPPGVVATWKPADSWGQVAAFRGDDVTHNSFNRWILGLAANQSKSVTRSSLPHLIRDSDKSDQLLMLALAWDWNDLSGN
jgi:hypothetical protein